MEEEAVRWSIKVSKDTDLTLRTFLGAQGMKKGDLSKFIEEAVRRRVLQCTIQDIRARNADADPDEIQRIVDEAVSEVRAERRTRETLRALSCSDEPLGRFLSEPVFRRSRGGAEGRDLQPNRKPNVADPRSTR